MQRLGGSHSAQRLGAKLLLVAIYGSGPTVALYCGVSECPGDYCCSGQCCMRDKIYLDSSWYGPLFISMMVAFSFMCLCGLCNRLCRSSVETHTNDVEAGRPRNPTVSLTDSGTLVTPVIPQQENFGEPPPYSEVTSKPFLYPSPEGQPPPYSSLVIADAGAREAYIQAAL